MWIMTDLDVQDGAAETDDMVNPIDRVKQARSWSGARLRHRNNVSRSQRPCCDEISAAGT